MLFVALENALSSESGRTRVDDLTERSWDMNEEHQAWNVFINKLNKKFGEAWCGQSVVLSSVGEEL